MFSNFFSRKTQIMKSISSANKLGSRKQLAQQLMKYRAPFLFDSSFVSAISNPKTYSLASSLLRYSATKPKSQ